MNVPEYPLHLCVWATVSPLLTPDLFALLFSTFLLLLVYGPTPNLTLFTMTFISFCLVYVSFILVFCFLFILGFYLL